jgi:hypothetical protein
MYLHQWRAGRFQKSVRWDLHPDRGTVRMGDSYFSDFYLLWTNKSNLDIADTKVAAKLLLNCDRCDLANRSVD